MSVKPPRQQQDPQAGLGYIDGDMVSIARKNLLHDKGRLAITLLGVAAALVLITFGAGMAVGTLGEMVLPIDQMKADIWVVVEGTRDIVAQSRLPSDTAQRVGAVAGVADMHELVYVMGKIALHGEEVQAQIVGSAPGDSAVRPWGVFEGRAADLARPRTVIIDESAQKKLGAVAVGDAVKINGTTEWVTGRSSGAKSFIYPYVFTSLKTARQLAHYDEGETSYLLVDVQRDQRVSAVARRISRLNGVSAVPAGELRANTIGFMLFESGMGMGMGIMVLLGLLVGAVVISLTIYTATMERVPEFGMLKAIGARRRDIYRIVLAQVFMSVTLGYLLGIAVSFGLALLVSERSLMPVTITPSALAAAYVGTLALSALGGLASVRRVNRIDPAIVFRA